MMSRGDDSNRQCQCALPVSTTRASHGGALMHGALTMLLRSLLGIGATGYTLGVGV